MLFGVLSGMKYNLFFLLLLLGFSPCFVHAQEDEFRPCGTMDAINQSLSDHPELRQNLDNLEQFTRDYLQNSGNKLLDSTITIPVVFHVFHTYGSERISEAQIRDCIRIMNEDFQNLAADSSLVSTLFKPLIGRPQIRFRLARKDPNGRCTEGINYIESSLHTQGGENLKSIVSWDTKKYLNIWVCSVVASGAAAYSYYPGTAPGLNNEGVVSRSDYVGSIGSSQSGYRARTMTHEVGHYLNLPHTWGNSNSPGAASNCNIDDGVDDTPVCVGVANAGCPLTDNTCGSIANVENHMEYSNCRRMFTKGQVLRMHAAINSSTAFRSSLWKASNLIATGTTTDVPPTADCPPKPDFKSNITRLCAGQPVAFTQLAYNVASMDSVKFLWKFSGGNPSTSTSPNPTVSFTDAGSYDVKLIVSNQFGKDSLTKTGFIGILPSEPSYSETDQEDFSATTFPVFPGSPNKVWDIKNLSVSTWKRSTAAFVSTPASLSITNPANASGNVHTLITPVFQINGSLSNVRVGFRYAFARRTSTNTDKLVISYSTDCGKTWYQGFNKTGANLATTTTLVTSNFVPTSTQWKQDYANISFLFGNNTFRLKFEFTAGGGNNLYIDDLQLLTVTSVSNLQDDELSLNIYPNPSQALPTIEIQHARASSATIEVVDALGKSCLWKQDLFLSPGNKEINLSQEADRQRFRPGVYWIRLQVADRVMVRQLHILP